MEDPALPNPSQAPPAQSGQLRPLARRLLALALLGTAIALAVVQITNAVRHDAQVQIELMSDTAARLERLELAVAEADQSGPPALLTVFRFDEQHPPPAPIEHTFSLPNGRYELLIKLHLVDDPEPVRIRKQLEVSGEATTRYRLP